jgi:hypothetical protein
MTKHYTNLLQHQKCFYCGCNNQIRGLNTIDYLLNK